MSISGIRPINTAHISSTLVAKKIAANSQEEILLRTVADDRKPSHGLRKNRIKAVT